MKDITVSTSSAAQPRAVAPSATDDEVHQISLLEAANVLLRWRYLLVFVPLLLGGFVAVSTLTGPRTYTATASFLPQSNNGARSGVGGLAAQFGLAVSGGVPEESPQFYADLVRSHAILGALADSTYRTSAGANQRLEQILGIKGASPAIAREMVVDILNANTAVSTSTLSGIVRISVSTSDRAVSRQLASRFVKLINDFNLRRRQSRAGAERNFVQERLAVARAELNAAEARLSAFLGRNRQYGSAPELAIERDRLERAVSMQQQVFTTLTQSYEQARIEEVRNIPVITVIEEPVEPLKPDSRKVVTKVLVALILGLILAVIAAFFAEFVWRARSHESEDYREFARLWRSTIGDFRHPLRGLRTAFRR